MLDYLTRLRANVMYTWLPTQQAVQDIFMKSKQIQALVPCSWTSKARWWQIKRRNIVVGFTTSVNSSTIFCRVVWNQQRLFFVAFCLLRIHVDGDLPFPLNATVRCPSITIDTLWWNLPRSLEECQKLLMISHSEITLLASPQRSQ